MSYVTHVGVNVNCFGPLCPQLRQVRRGKQGLLLSCSITKNHAGPRIRCGPELSDKVTRQLIWRLNSEFGVYRKL